MATLSPLDHLLQVDARAYVEDVLGSENWLTVYGRMPGPLSGDVMFSALVPSDRVDDVLSWLSWDLSIGGGEPGFSQGGDETTYHRWSSSGGVEPFVVVRTFHTDIDGAQQVELVEEFRLLFNLAYVPRDEEYLDVSTGTPRVVARWRDGRMEVNRKLMRQFLAVKGMHLALFFQSNRYSTLGIDDVPGGAHDDGEKRDDLVYELNVRDATEMMSSGNTFSKLIGKKLVAPFPIERAGVWPYDEDRQYVSFTIGVDEDGRPVEHTCDSDTLANYFGKNPEAPHFLQPVHFRREVLAKYYGDSSRYDVSDGMVHCGSLWGLRMDNDHADRVVVHLGDLASIPYEEQMYWRSFNVEPDGGISETAYQRGVLAQFADPAEPALAFRLAYERTNKAWEAALGWPLFKSLSASDQHNLDGIRVPLNDGAAEFDSQVLSLAKAAIDSLNEKPIRKAAIAAGFEYEGGEQGIAKFVGYLDATGFDASAHGLDRLPTGWMKDVQWLRSRGSAHRKASDYVDLVEHFGIDDRGRPAVMRDLLAEGTRMLNALVAHAEGLAAGEAPEAA